MSLATGIPGLRYGTLRAVAAISLAVLAAGCSTQRIFGGGEGSNASASTAASGYGSPTTASPSVGSRFAELFGTKNAQPETSLPLYANPVETVCPDITVRQGAATLILPPGNTDPYSLRYQGTIGDMARDCKVTDHVMHMKVGVQGRVLVGPAGGPGDVELPLRIAVVQEGPQPRTIVSKLAKVSVSIPDGKTDNSFVHIDSDVSFPVVDEINSYIVYVGFDPVAETKKPVKKPATKPRKPAAHT